MIGRRVGRLVALPVAAIVEGDHPPAVVGQRLDPARIDPVDAMVGGEAVDQQDRLAAVVALRGDVDKGQPQAVGIEELDHARRCLFLRPRRNEASPP